MQPEPVPTSKILEFLLNDNSNVHSTINSVSGRGINTLGSTKNLCPMNSDSFNM
jgi:hypothetical protein